MTNFQQAKIQRAAALYLSKVPSEKFIYWSHGFVIFLMFHILFGFLVFNVFITSNELNKLREKFPNTELFMVRIFLYSVQIQENTDQENSILTHFSLSVHWGSYWFNPASKHSRISYKSNFLTLIKKDFSKQAMQYFGFDVNA